VTTTLRALSWLHDQWRKIADDMERDGTAKSYPVDYDRAVKRADFYADAAVKWEKKVAK